MKKSLIILTVFLLTILFTLPVMAEDAPDQKGKEVGSVVDVNAPGVKDTTNDITWVNSKTTTPKPSSIIVYVNNQLVSFQGQQPIMSNNRVLVPVRGVFEKIGANVTWNPDEKKVTATKKDIKITLWAAKTKAYKGAQVITLDQPAKLSNGRVLVPLRFISEALGAKVDWVKTNNAVYVELK